MNPGYPAPGQQPYYPQQGGQGMQPDPYNPQPPYPMQGQPMPGQPQYDQYGQPMQPMPQQPQYDQNGQPMYPQQPPYPMQGQPQPGNYGAPYAPQPGMPQQGMPQAPMQPMPQQGMPQAPMQQGMPPAIQPQQGPYVPAPGPQAGQSNAPAPPGQSALPYEPPPVIPANLPPNAIRGFVVSYQSNPQGEFWPLNGGRMAVGRANSGEQVDLPLPDATTSSKHAAFIVDVASGVVTVEDRGSTNGTYVNEEHIGYSGRRDLRDGDRVRFGGFTTVVKILPRS
jgi:FHA domain